MTDLRPPLFKFILMFLAWFGLTISPALAMSKDDDIDTNRPSFMDSPLVLPQSSVQFENGTLFQGFHGAQWQYDIPETEVRVGLTKNTEFQAFVPNFNLLKSQVATSPVTPGAITSSGPSDRLLGTVSDITEIGLKRQLGPLFPDSKVLPGYLRNYNLAVIVGVTPPTGASQISGTGTAGTVRFPWSKGVGKNWSIAGMQSLLLINSGHDLQYQPDVLVGRNIGAHASVFVEYGGFFTQGAAPLNIMHFGGVYKIHRHHQIDTQFGFGMNGAAPIAFVGFGYSYRFDRLKW